MSDGQFFQAAGFGRDASRLNAHYGTRPGFKVYTHLSDRYGPFFTKLIAATASEALHVLDALLYHQSEVPTGRHHTDGGGDSDHVFALCSLLGFQFAPRIPDLKHRRLYSFGKPSDYPTLEPMIGGRINLALIRAHWKAILRIVASIRTGTVTASVIMRKRLPKAAYLIDGFCEMLGRPDVVRLMSTTVSGHYRSPQAGSWSIAFSRGDYLFVREASGAAGASVVVRH